MIAVPRWLWLVGGLAMLTLLLLWRVNALAERRGYDRAAQEASEVADAAGKAMAQQVREAEARAAKSAQARTHATRKATDAVLFHYSTRPDDAGALCLPDDRVRSARKARADITSASAGKRD